MDCETARDKSVSGETDAEVQAHLEGCAACRGEFEFREQVRAAVAAMPRAAAPEGLLSCVMAELSGPGATHESAAPPRQLALRSWELAGLSLLCLLIIGLLPALLARWFPGGLTSTLPSLGSPSAIRGALDDGWQTILGLWRDVTATGISLSDTTLTWLCGAVAFAVALALLLGWRSGGEGPRRLEDAHA